MDKLRALTVYKTTGNQTKTANLTGIPIETIRTWMKAEWWDEQIRNLKKEDSTVLEDAATTIAKKSAEVVQERLDNGDYILGKDGELVRKPVSARDAAIIGAVAIDKRKILQEEPVREIQLGTTERLLKLVEQFARLTNQKEIKTIIDAEIINDSQDLERLPSKVGERLEESL